MLTNKNQNLQQAVVITDQSEIRPGQNAVQLALFGEDGDPFVVGESADLSSYAKQEDLDAAVARIEALENTSEG